MPNQPRTQYLSSIVTAMKRFGQYAAACCITAIDVMTKSLKTAKQRATVNIRALSTFRCTFTTFVSGQLVLPPLGSFETLHTSFFTCKVRPGSQLRSFATAACTFILIPPDKASVQTSSILPLQSGRTSACIVALQETMTLSPNHRAKDKKKSKTLKVKNCRKKYIFIY